MAEQSITLGDSLLLYGVPVDHWRDLDTATERANQALRKSLEPIRDVPNMDKLFADAVTARGPLFVSLGDKLLEEGFEDPAYFAYVGAVYSEKEARSLLELGYLFLQRCRIETLPLCEADFYSSWMQFPDGEEMHLWSTWIDTEDLGPEFPSRSRLLRLAINAFGLAWSWFSERGGSSAGPTREEYVRGLFALDGLRVCFTEVEDFESAIAVCQRYRGWNEDWWKTDVDDFAIPFEANFREAEAYFRGRRDGARLAVIPRATEGQLADLSSSQRLILWHLKELMETTKASTSSEQAGLADKVAEAITHRLNLTPVYVFDGHEKVLLEELGHRFEALPQPVRRLVVQSEYLRSILHRAVDSDWSPVVLQLVRAVETELRVGLGPQLDSLLQPRYLYTRANIEAFVRLFRGPELNSKSRLLGSGRVSALKQVGSELDTILKDYRNPAVHSPNVASPVTSMELRRLVLGDDKDVGLLWRIHELSQGAKEPS